MWTLYCHFYKKESFLSKRVIFIKKSPFLIPFWSTRDDSYRKWIPITILVSKFPISNRDALRDLEKAITSLAPTYLSAFKAIRYGCFFLLKSRLFKTWICLVVRLWTNPVSDTCCTSFKIIGSGALFTKQLK